jgi:hypothetical protein
MFSLLAIVFLIFRVSQLPIFLYSTPPFLIAFLRITLVGFKAAG